MPDIKVLDSHIADLIAAGEVVERPASVAKELMENAIDAGARKVTVEIAHGGMTFLRVTDDGCGIPAAQLPTAFLRHATSKLRTEYDLEAIGTLGFRGEALAAIAAVSRIEVMTCTSDAPMGSSLTIEGGEFGAVEEAGCPQGTTIVVRDLFFNTPARLKFMKKDAAEGAAVYAVVQRVALSHPEVSVKFIRDGKQEMLTPGDGQLKSAVYAVLGRELALGFREVKAAGEDMTVTGFVSLPACCRGSRNYQFFFVNGRQVKSRLMMAALEEAYQNQKMVGKFPGCVLHLETKLNAVDVNVHPAKTEVKFGSERQVFSAVYHAVLSALEGDKSHVRMQNTEGRMQNGARPADAPPRRPVNVLDSVTPNQVRIQANITRLNEKKPVTSLELNDSMKPRFAPAGGEPRERHSEPVRRLVTESVFPEVPPSVGFADSSPSRGEPRPPQSASRTSPLDKGSLPPQGGSQGSLSLAALDSSPKGRAETPSVGFADRSPSGGEPRERYSEPVRTPVTESVPPAAEPEAIPWRMAGEVLNTYIIVEQGESVFFIDKHAAHERMNFDRMKAQGYEPMKQTLLTPVICRMGESERQVLLSHRELLEEFGFDAEELGNALAVRQVPFDVAPGEVEETLSEIALKLLDGRRVDPAAARDEVLHTMACKAAIKGGWRSGEKELEVIVRAVMAGEVKYCPHGRPVAIELTKKDLEKQFKRS